MGAKAGHKRGLIDEELRFCIPSIHHPYRRTEVFLVVSICKVNDYLLMNKLTPIDCEYSFIYLHFMKLENDLYLRASSGRIEHTRMVDAPAGRILPEYREVRASVSGFKELAETPDLASEVTVQPVDLLGVDAAIIFSDILS